MARKHTQATGLTILVVDDQYEARESLRILLERRGHRVVTAGSGIEALKVFAASDMDLVVTDFSMPGMNGAEFVQRLRGLDQHLPIVLQTGYAVGAGEGCLPREQSVDGYHERTSGPIALLDMIEALLPPRVAATISGDVAGRELPTDGLFVAAGA